MKDIQYWKSLSKSLTLRGMAYIDGDFRAAIGGETFASVNPATEELLLEVASCDERDVDIAVASGLKTFRSGVWAKMSPGDRKRILQRLASLMEEHKDELAVLDTIDMGKPISEMANIDVPDAIDCMHWTAETIDKLYGEIAPTNNKTLGLISHNPVGVVGAITPWNYPLLMNVWKLAPALASGNSVVLKPSEKASLSVLRLAELATEAGLPNGVLNVVPGLGHTAGRALALHHDVSVLTFTGSSRVAGMLMEYSGQSNIKRVLIEAGGKSPMLVFDDCDDVEAAAIGAGYSIFSNQGEVCIACSRLYLQSGIKDEFLTHLKRIAEGYRVGDPLDPATTMGAMVDKNQLDTVDRYVKSATDEGGTLLTGGISSYESGQGYFPKPTIITDSRQDMSFVKEEIFGPVLAVAEFNTEEEAIALANDTIYGLGASVWTGNLSRAHRVSANIDAGMVWVNGWGGGDSTMPFGGIKASGNGRDKSLHSMEKYTDLKTVWISL